MANRFCDYFDRTFVINLPYRHDRRRAITRELKRVEMFPAPERTEIFPAIRPDDAGPYPTRGTRGCFISHWSILRKALEQNLSRVLVMEDDLVISDRWHHQSDRLVDELEATGWDMVYFYHALHLQSQAQKAFATWDGSVRGALFYGVHGRILERLVEFLAIVDSRPAGHPDGGPMHVDGAFSTFRKQNLDVRTLVAVPRLGRQRASRTDIHALGFHDRLIGVRWVADIARGIKELVRTRL